MFGIVNLQCDALVCIKIGQGSCRSNRPFYLFFLSSLVLEIWSFTVYFSEKGDHYYIQTRHKDLFFHYNRILRKL